MIKRRGLGLRIFRFLKKLFIFLFLFQFFYLLLIKWVNPPITITQLTSLVKFEGLKRDYVNLDEISSYAKLAVIATEDQLFADHNGFDWKGIEKAIEYNKTNEGKK